MIPVSPNLCPIRGKKNLPKQKSNLRNPNPLKKKKNNNIRKQGSHKEEPSRSIPVAKGTHSAGRFGLQLAPARALQKLREGLSKG